MSIKHRLPDHLISVAQQMFLKDQHWVSYNSLSYELGEGDIEFFQNKQQAKTFVQNNSSEKKNYQIIYASSIMDLIGQLSYGNSISGSHDLQQQLNTIL